LVLVEARERPEGVFGEGANSEGVRVLGIQAEVDRDLTLSGFTGGAFPPG